MKAKYYLARLLCGSIQYSDDYYTSYQKAVNIRSRQVNPQQWMIIVNPIFDKNSSRIDVNLIAEKQSKRMRDLYNIVKEIIHEI